MRASATSFFRVRAREQELSAGGCLVFHDATRQRCQQMMFDRATQRPRSEVRREAAVEQELDCRRLPFHHPVAVAQAAASHRTIELLVQDIPHQRTIERIEKHDAIDAIEELATECFVQRFLDHGS